MRASKNDDDDDDKGAKSTGHPQLRPAMGVAVDQEVLIVGSMSEGVPEREKR